MCRFPCRTSSLQWMTRRGVLGGLTLSAMKRAPRAKDRGAMIESHGGVLDWLELPVSIAASLPHLRGAPACSSCSIVSATSTTLSGTGTARC